MTHVDIHEAQARLAHYVELAQSGEVVRICQAQVPVAELVPVAQKIDVAKRRAFFGKYEGFLDEAVLAEAMRPMSDDEADAFIEGR